MYLVINCAEGDLQIVLGNSERLWFSSSLYVPGRAMKHMAPGIVTALESLELETHELQGIACVSGPGSFTGVRMSLAHALGMACAHSIPLAGLSFMQALAMGPGPLIHGTLVVLVHSRREQVYAQVFSCPDLTASCPAKNLHLSELKDLLSSCPGPVYLAGSGLRRNMDFFHPRKSTVLSLHWDVPSPHNLLRMALNASWNTPLPAPEYLRDSEAEENLSRIAAGRGLDLNQAREYLQRE
ncbi:tRNA (adenosine(37)-N6)-threonylcarbamoyltransferase complex dimerization subunit type 1 TsaB [Desulfonatronospira sp.]|uniref:tRNA (adenosine(37)-N6)-threonylcarbamoyltransferase complex dimerization subunit type 1 TsaB n=1 Tax=Desulfonatronospira sp. TaxID=1962951 RepID=UPI0025C3DFAF|nr:tRNA (adenosine(37)-N6)-threonylcarbamoyltransferase complex dimerization subunit type 1 TsaB [Desulfonatronospira sp.]